MVRARSWSVARHLGAIVVGVTLTLAFIGGLAALATIRGAESDVLDDADFQARLAASAIDDAFEISRDQAASLAANPDLAGVFEDPDACGLVFSDDSIFQGGHLDILAPDGPVACSSVTRQGAPDGASHARAPWLDDALAHDPADGALTTAPFRDQLTGDMSIAFVVPGVDAAGGPPPLLVAIVVPVGRLDDGLAELLGGPDGYRFSVVDAHGDVLTDERDGGFGRENPMAASGVLAGSVEAGDGWRVHAGLERSVALGATYALLWRAAGLAVLVLLVILVSLAIVHRRIAAPLRRLTDAVADASHGAARIPVPPTGPTEIALLAEEFNETVAVRHEYEQQLAHQALHDSLTGLPNRALLSDRLAQSLAAADEDEAVAVVFIDLDQFKLVNDGLGHAVGDQVLVILGARLSHAVRRGDTVARFGGDEFIVIATCLSGPTDATEIAQHLHDVISAPIEVDRRRIQMTASIGIALGSRLHSADDLIQEADTAMYVAKSHGPGRSEVFTTELHDRARGRLQVESQLRQALDRNELWLAYQPKVDLVTGAVVGVEALMRWDNPTLGSVPPSTFIPIAEETNLIGPLGRFAVTEALRQLSAWRLDGFDLEMSINVSARQIVTPGLTDLIARALVDHRVPARSLCLEVTETALMSDIARAADVLAELRAMGTRISIDDFGTGYCSMAYLQQFEVNELKVDRAFVRDITTNAGQHALVSAIIAMASALGLRVVAEGIEYEEQADVLRLLQCDYAQGYHFARPQRPAEISLLLRRQARPAVNR